MELVFGTVYGSPWDWEDKDVQCGSADGEGAFLPAASFFPLAMVRTRVEKREDTFAFCLGDSPPCLTCCDPLYRFPQTKIGGGW